MVYNRTHVTEPIGKVRWPLDTDADMVVSVGTASKELRDFKVRGHFLTEKGWLSPPPSKVRAPPWQFPFQTPHLTKPHKADHSTHTKRILTQRHRCPNHANLHHRSSVTHVHMSTPTKHKLS